MRNEEYHVYIPCEYGREVTKLCRVYAVEEARCITHMQGEKNVKMVTKWTHTVTRCFKRINYNPLSFFLSRHMSRSPFLLF